MSSPKKTKVQLFLLLIVLNVILRMPIYFYEIGWDSFNIHILANAISYFGKANYWESVYSVFGFYPLSYASSLPFLISGLSQLSNLANYYSIFIISVFLGIFCIFSSYSMSTFIRKDYPFIFIFTLLFSISSGVLFLTTYTASTRGLFIAYIPLLIYSMIKISYDVKIKSMIIFIMLFVFLMSTHHLFFFTIPLIMSFIVANVLFWIKNSRHTYFFRGYSLEFIFMVLLLASIILPFLMHLFWSFDPTIQRLSIGGSKYAVLESVLYQYTRYIGVLIPFVVSGYIFVLLNKNKTTIDYFLLTIPILLLPFIYLPTYMEWFLLPIVTIYISIALSNICRNMSYKLHFNIFSIFIIFLLLSGSLFSSYYQFSHFESDDSRIMKDSTYHTGVWINRNVNGSFFYTNGLIALRVFSISQVSTLFGDSIGLSYGYYNSTQDLNLSKNSPFSVSYYIDGPVVKTPGAAYIEGDINQLHLSEYNSKWGQYFISKYDITHVIQYKLGAQTTFMQSIYPVHNEIYDNGKISLWSLTNEI
ncbi:hypothetical protein [Methanolobus vulcani]|uniref:Dolichyl-phosphate-mannose-protein mannosyltransferase n=1 Tax=Methanolobus vulcani TaxID=38026 RepID=A0A7Z8KS90_9EURY|nr:hypothetical protein [Methanolobus vulcani]TQD27265.1 hypothetical protein FKV42_03300 [Methanolobus vulcani]